AVGNWSGVTHRAENATIFFQGEGITFFDLPGIYSLSGHSQEEKIVLDFLASQKIDLILNVVSCENLQRQLFLSTQLTELKIPMVLALNMADLLPEMGITLDLKKMSSLLKIPCLKISAEKKQGLQGLLRLLQDEGKKQKAPPELHPERRSTDTAARYALAAEICRISIKKLPQRDTKKFSPDKLFCHPILAWPLFLSLMLLLFYLSFGPLGQGLTALLESFCKKHIATGLHLFFRWIDLPLFFSQLLTDGAFLGISGILIFLPQLAILFFGLAILETSGYMARLAFLLDRPLSRFGLSGQSAIPLLLGWACSLPGILACRAIEGTTERKSCMLLIPFMSCSARMPVYALLCSVFFPEKAWFIISFLYVLGLTFALLLASLRMAKIPREKTFWMLELPPYRKPSLHTLSSSAYRRCRDFFTKAFSAVLLTSILLWLLSHVDPELQPTEEISQSLLAQLGKWSSPFFKQMGCGHWQIAMAAWSGLLSKEMAVAGFSVLGLDGTALRELLEPAAAAAFLVFFLLYTPCIATLKLLREESGSLRLSLAVAFSHLLLAWLTASSFYQLLERLIL
ncbi:MAG: ferrous iron transporter B, partial [Bacillota bacterium]|nr:ferrous iron transporter B [Bacillota bacterium]